MDCQLLFIMVTHRVQSGVLASWTGLEGSRCQPTHSYLLRDLSDLVSLIRGRLSPGPSYLESGQVTFGHTRWPGPVA